MRKGIYILLIALAFYGCSQSYMKVGVVNDKDPYVLYGKYPTRNISYDFLVTDSLKELWSKETNGSFSNSSVSVYNEYVFVSDLSGRVYAYNTMSGKKVGELKSKGSVFAAPFINRNILIYITAQAEHDRSIMYFYDIADNKPVRETEITGRVISEILSDKGYLYMCTESGIVYKYDMNGVKVWERKTSVKTHSSPVMSEGCIYFGNDSGEIIAVSSESGDIVYRKKIGGFFHGGGMIAGKQLFIGNNNGGLYSVNTASGKVDWEYKSGSKIMMTPVSDSNYVYAGNLSGSFFALDKNTGNVKWAKTLGKLLNTAPAVTENYLLIPDLFKKLYIVDKANGALKNTLSLDNRVKLTPVIFNKKILIIGYDNGVLNAYEFE